LPSIQDPAIDVRPPESLNELLPRADYVIVACPETPKTRGLFDRARIALMAPGSILINVARGSIVSLEALTDALERGAIGGAALDVFELEPLPEDHPLWAREDVIITPHTAGYGPTVAESHLAVLIDNLRRFADNTPLRNIIDKHGGF
jgi:phosphoglycerate dehydrogenase-like enzyme